MKTLDQLISENLELTANLARITAELNTAKEGLVSAQTAHAELTAKLTTAASATAEVQAKLETANTELTTLKAKDMDVDVRAAAKVKAAGIAGTEGKQKEKEEPKLTATELCLKARNIEFKQGESHIVTN